MDHIKYGNSDVNLLIVKLSFLIQPMSFFFNMFDISHVIFAGEHFSYFDQMYTLYPCSFLEIKHFEYGYMILFVIVVLHINIKKSFYFSCMTVLWTLSGWRWRIWKDLPRYVDPSGNFLLTNCSVSNQTIYIHSHQKKNVLNLFSAINSVNYCGGIILKSKSAL